MFDEKDFINPKKKSSEILNKFSLDVLKRKEQIVKRSEKIRAANISEGNVKPINPLLEQIKLALELKANRNSELTTPQFRQQESLSTVQSLAPAVFKKVPSILKKEGSFPS